MAEQASRSSPLVLVLQSALVVAAVGILLWSVYKIENILFDVLLSCVLAAVLFPPVQWLQRRNWPRRLSVLVFYLIFLMLMTGIIYLIGNIVVEQGRMLMMTLPWQMEAFTGYLQNLPFVEPGDPIYRTLTQNLQTLGERAMNFLMSAVDYVIVFFTSLIDILIILVLTFYLIADTGYFHDVFVRLFPAQKRDSVSSLLRKLAGDVGKYVRGQLLVMLSVGMMVWIGLSIVGVPYAFMLGVISFLLDFIPMIGPIVATVLGTIIALGISPDRALWAFLVFFAVQQLENYIIYPRIMGKATGLHPAWVLIAVLSGGALLGITGVLLSIPVALLIKILMHRLCCWKDSDNPGPESRPTSA